MKVGEEKGGSISDQIKKQMVWWGTRREALPRGTDHVPTVASRSRRRQLWLMRTSATVCVCVCVSVCWRSWLCSATGGELTHDARNRNIKFKKKIDKMQKWQMKSMSNFYQYFSADTARGISTYLVPQEPPWEERGGGGAPKNTCSHTHALTPKLLLCLLIATLAPPHI